MDYMRQLEAAGFAGDTLGRAIAAAGASRPAYLALIQSVADGMSPAEALRVLEDKTPPTIS